MYYAVYESFGHGIYELQSLFRQEEEAEQYLDAKNSGNIFIEEYDHLHEVKQYQDSIEF